MILSIWTVFSFEVLICAFLAYIRIALIVFFSVTLLYIRSVLFPRRISGNNSQSYTSQLFLIKYKLYIFMISSIWTIFSFEVLNCAFLAYMKFTEMNTFQAGKMTTSSIFHIRWRVQWETLEIGNCDPPKFGKSKYFYLLIGFITNWIMRMR